MLEFSKLLELPIGFSSMEKPFRPFLFLITMLFGHLAYSAEELPQSMTLDGRFYSDSAATVPLADVVSLKVQILNPAQNCILYEETQSVDTTTSAGYYTVQIGQKVTPTGKRTSGDSGNGMTTVFSNTITSMNGKLASDGSTLCTYSPSSGDARYMKFVMTPASDGVARTTTTNMLLDSVPMALVAERAENLRGFTPSQFIQVNNSTAALTQANLESLFTTTGVSRLSTLVSVPATNYLQSAGNGSAGIPSVASDPGTGLGAGQLWYNSTSNTFKYYDAGSSSVKTLASTVGGSYLPLTGGTLTGSLIAPTIYGASTSAGDLTIDSTSHSTKGNILLATSGGNVGIGTTAPTSALNVKNGAIVSTSVANTGAYIDFTMGNVQMSSTSATTINICGLKDGGSYTLVLTGITTNSTVTVNAYPTYVNTTTCSGTAMTVDLSGGNSTFTAAGNTNILSFVYFSARGANGTVYGFPATNYSY